MCSNSRIKRRSPEGHKSSARSRRGVAYLFALAILALMTSMTVALMASTNMNLSRHQHMKDSMTAQLSAESGLQFMLMNFTKLRMPANTNSSTFAANLAEGIGDILNQTSNIGGQTVTRIGSTISIPPITAGDSTFNCTIIIMPPDANGVPQCRLTSVGSSGMASRTVSLDMQMGGRSADAFNYAIASKGGIAVTGSAVIDGMNEGSEASILSISQEAFAIEIGGSATVGGDLYLTADGENSVYLQGGGLSVGGTSDIDEIIGDHVHRLVDEPDFPTLDLTPFTALAATATVVDDTTDLTGQDMVFNNVRIAAGTNPEFKNDTVINGLLYIEAPNTVTFKSKVVLNAIIVTEDATGIEGDSLLDFKGQVSAPGVDALPDTAEFAGIKAQQGTIILAPGFGIEMHGAVNSINGTIAADQFSFLGASNISGEIAGTIIGLSSKDLVMSGNATILINKKDDNDAPAGFVHYQGVYVTENTYSEGN
jgi:hypothetical protein